MDPDRATAPVRAARAGFWWHLVNRAGASLCGEPGPWRETRPACANTDGPRCRVCRQRAAWLADAPPAALYGREAYRLWLQLDWWLAGGLVFRPAEGGA